jgi:hypothetical protein
MAWLCNKASEDNECHDIFGPNQKQVGYPTHLKARDVIFFTNTREQKLIGTVAYNSRRETSTFMLALSEKPGDLNASKTTSNFPQSGHPF